MLQKILASMPPKKRENTSIDASKKRQNTSIDSSQKIPHVIDGKILALDASKVHRVFAAINIYSEQKKI